jgi:hypothetical protein
MTTALSKPRPGWLRCVIKWGGASACALLAAAFGLSMRDNPWPYRRDIILLFGWSVSLDHAQLVLGREPIRPPGSLVISGSYLRLRRSASEQMFGFYQERWGARGPRYYCSLLTPLGLVAIPTAWAWCPRRHRPGTCPRCRYDLAGNATGVCPECGNDLEYGGA